MNYTIWLTIIALGILSFSQRLVPWLVLRKQPKGEIVDRLFGYFAIAAFSSLMIEELPDNVITDVIALLAALLVALRTKNVGLTVLSAMAVTLISGLIISGIAL